MNATYAHVVRRAGVALVVLTVMLVTADVSGAAIDEGTPAQTRSAMTTPTARDDCLAGRRRTGTSAFRLGVDPAPNCSALLAQQTREHSRRRGLRDAADEGRRWPGVLP